MLMNEDENFSTKISQIDNKWQSKWLASWNKDSRDRIRVPIATTLQV